MESGTCAKHSQRIKIEQHTFTGGVWCAAWLFTIGYLHLHFWHGFSPSFCGRTTSVPISVLSFGNLFGSSPKSNLCRALTFGRRKNFSPAVRPSISVKFPTSSKSTHLSHSTRKNKSRECSGNFLEIATLYLERPLHNLF